MAPIIEVSYKVLRDLKKSETPSNPSPPHGFKKDFTYVPSIRLYVEEESHLEESWDKAHDSPLEKKLRMLTIPEFVNFLNHVKDYNEEVYYNLTRVRKQWRIELLDAYFIEKKDGFYISTKNKRNTEKLKPTLMEEREHGISFDSWLKKPNSQGLPRPDIEGPNTNKDKLNYWSPKNNTVACLELNPEGISTIHCDLNPFSANRDVFRVRRCFSLEPEKNLERLK